MSWLETSFNVIEKALANVPADADFHTVDQAIAAAYPFGEREHHPYKQWLKARKRVLDWRFNRAPRRLAQSGSVDGTLFDGMAENAPALQPRVRSAFLEGR